MNLKRLSTLQAALIIVVLGLAVFSIGLKNSFQGDDNLQIINNPVVHSLSHVVLFFDGGTFYSGHGITPLAGTNYRPLMTTVFSFIYTLFGTHTFYYHAFQLALSIGGAIFLYLVLRYTFNSLLSLILALVFLIHPLNSQVVLAIPSMQDALFFFWGIFAFWLLLRFSSRKSLWVVALLLFLSLLSKESGILFVAVSALYLLWWDRKRFIPFASILLLPVTTWFLLRLHAVGLAAKSINAPIDRLNLLGRLLTAPSIIQFYITKFIFPWKLASAYYWVYPTFTFSHFVLPMLFDVTILTLIVITGYLLKRHTTKARYFTYWFFAIWAFLGLIPVLQIFPLDMTASETWFYFSSVGILAMLGIIITSFQTRIRPSVFYALAGVLILLLSVRTFVRTRDWSTAYQLERTDIVNSKEDYIAYNDLASYELQQHNFKVANVYVEKSVKIFPFFGNYINLGQAKGGLGDFNGAIAAYERSLRYNSDFETTYEDLAELTLVTGGTPSDEVFVKEALQKFPQDSKVWTFLAILEFANNDPTAAKASITTATQYGPTPEFIYNAIMSNQPFLLNLPDLGTRVRVK